MSTIRTLLVANGEERNGTASALEQGDCTVTAVDTATAALAELSTGEFDCLVSEYELPGDDGLSLLEAVRKTEPELPFVMVAADGDETVASQALLNGATRYVPRNGVESLDRLGDCVSEVAATTPDPPDRQDVSDHEPSTDEIARAVDEAPIGITLSEPSLPNNPIVYCNDAWQELTGYDRSDVLGRNPRLLQGPETDRETAETVREAIESERATTVEIRNYRSDGTPFWNELTVAPIYDDEGELTQYVGFQTDISDRKAAERIADQREAKLAAERATLETVLDRVDGVLNDIAGTLVAESDRTVIEDRICAEIADSTGYVASWIAKTNPADTSVRLTASAGLPDTVDTDCALDAVPEAVASAAESNDPACHDAADGSPVALGPASIGAHRLYVVPLIYGRSRHGLLGVYATDDALDSRERRLFDAIGTMIANGLHAVETSRLLTTDRVRELRVVVEDDRFLLSVIADRLDTEIEYVAMTDSGAGSEYELYVRTTEPIDRSPSVLSECSIVEATRTVAETATEVTIAVTLDRPTPFPELADHGATVEKASADSERTRLRLITPPEREVRPVLAVLESRYDHVDLCSQRGRDRRDRTPAEFVSQMDARLTDRQQTALETAYLNGYFEWPRPVDGTELAETMGISRQTFHQHLRAAERKLVDGYLGRVSN